MLPPRENGERKRKEGVDKWRLTREKILMFCGLAVIGAEFINAELFHGTFHSEFLLVGAALCGISITQWGDKGGR